LQVLENSLGPDNFTIARTLFNLGFLYKIKGRYADAEPLYKRTLSIEEKAVGSEHPDFAKICMVLAICTSRSVGLPRLRPYSSGVWQYKKRFSAPNIAMLREH